MPLPILNVMIEETDVDSFVVSYHMKGSMPEAGCSERHFCRVAKPACAVPSKIGSILGLECP